MRLLVTRPEPDASTFAEELREAGYEPVLQPLLEFQALAFDPALLGGASALVITSGNSLRAIESAPALAEMTRLPLYCVGEETARRAHALGFETVRATAETAERLADEIIAREKGRTVHLTGEHQAFDLAAALKRASLSIETIPVYSMDACRTFAPSVLAMIKASEIDGVILMSPRTAEVYGSLCHRHAVLDFAKTPMYFCLSNSVASRLASLNPNQVLVSEKPNRKVLLELLHTHCQRRVDD